jgi:hypothetical protein
MEFKFKRKYTSFFLLALILHVGVACFWFFAPNNIFQTSNGKQHITLLLLINCELILLFYFGLYRKKYFAYYNKLTIKRSLLKTISIDYKAITKIKENENDSIVLGFGKRPSFKIFYKNNTQKEKKYTVRSDNNELLLKVIKNEISIANFNNTNNK